MSDDTYEIGDVVRLTITITDMSGVQADPTGELTLTLKPPADDQKTYAVDAPGEIVRDAQGIYHADVQVTASGVWAYRWQVGLPNAGAVSGTLIVKRSRVVL